MMLSNVRDVDFTIARIHAHHASMIDGERLEAMCRIRTIPELARHIWGEANPAMSSGELQRRFFADFAEEVEHLASRVPEGVRLFFEVLKECRNTFQHISLESDIEKACEYYAELLQRAHSCKAPHNKDAVEIAAQEAGIFLGMLSLRLTFNYAFKPEKVESFFFEGSALSRLQFAQITHAKDLEEALNVCSGDRKSVV